MSEPRSRDQLCSESLSGRRSSGAADDRGMMALESLPVKAESADSLPGSLPGAMAGWSRNVNFAALLPKRVNASSAYWGEDSTPDIGMGMAAERDGNLHRFLEQAQGQQQQQEHQQHQQLQQLQQQQQQQQQQRQQQQEQQQQQQLHHQQQLQQQQQQQLELLQQQLLSNSSLLTGQGQLQGGGSLQSQGGGLVQQALLSDDPLVRALLNQTSSQPPQSALLAALTGALGSSSRGAMDPLSGSSIEDALALLRQGATAQALGAGPYNVQGQAPMNLHQLERHILRSSLPRLAPNDVSGLLTDAQLSGAATWPPALLSQSAEALLAQSSGGNSLARSLLQSNQVLLGSKLGTQSTSKYGNAQGTDGALAGASATAAAASLRLAQSVQAMQELRDRKGPAAGDSSQGGEQHQNAAAGYPGLASLSPRADPWTGLAGDLASTEGLGPQGAIGPLSFATPALGTAAAPLTDIAGSRKQKSKGGGPGKKALSAMKHEPKSNGSAEAETENESQSSMDGKGSQGDALRSPGSSAAANTTGSRKGHGKRGASGSHTTATEPKRQGSSAEASGSRRSEPQTEEEKRLRKLALNREAARRMRRRQATRLEQLEKTVLELQAANVATRNRLREAERKVGDLERKNEGLEERVVTVIGSVMGNDQGAGGVKDKVAALVSCLSGKAFEKLPEELRSLVDAPAAAEEEGGEGRAVAVRGGSPEVLVGSKRKVEEALVGAEEGDEELVEMDAGSGFFHPDPLGILERDSLDEEDELSDSPEAGGKGRKLP